MVINGFIWNYLLVIKHGKGNPWNKWRCVAGEIIELQKGFPATLIITRGSMALSPNSKYLENTPKSNICILGDFQECDDKPEYWRISELHFFGFGRCSESLWHVPSSLYEHARYHQQIVISFHNLQALELGHYHSWVNLTKSCSKAVGYINCIEPDW